MFFSLLLFIVTLSSPVWAQQKGWEKEWNETLSAAKKEGKVVVADSPDPAMREISAKFKERFGITVEHIFATSQLAARLNSEQQAGVYTVDVFMGESRLLPLFYTGQNVESRQACANPSGGRRWRQMEDGKLGLPIPRKGMP
jgi:hypothetical protein